MGLTTPKRSPLSSPQAVTAQLDAYPPADLDQPTVRLPVPNERSLARHASIVAAAFVASRMLGMVRETLFARQFGTGDEYAAYVAAFRVPDLLFLVVMAGSFGSAFIPVFAGFLSRGDQRRAWALASAVLNLAAVSIVVSAVIAFVFAGPIVRFLVAPGFSAENQQLTVELMRLLLLSPIMLGLGIAAKGILEAQDRFTLPALAPLVYNVAIVLSVLLLAPSIGVHGVAIGVVVGAFGHVLVQIPGLIRSGMVYSSKLTLRVDGLGEVGRLLLPRVIGQAAFQVNFIVVTSFASREGADQTSSLSYAWQLLMFPHGVLALSISTVIFPTMARLFEQGRTVELKATLARALRPLLFLTLPASIGLFAFRTPIVSALFEWGAFSERSTALTADALAFFALGLTGYAVVEVLTRAFYAMHDTRTPVAAGITIMVINIVLCAVLIGPLGHAGLALALSASTAVETLILSAVLRRRLGRGDAQFAGWLARVAVATLAMAIAAFATAGPLAMATRPGAAPRPLQLALFAYTLGVVGAVYVLAAFYLRLPEVDRALDRVGARAPRLVRLVSSLR